jgi:hypothetical protein
MSQAEPTHPSTPVFAHPVLLAAHTPESWARAVIAAGVQALVAATGNEHDPNAGVWRPLQATLTVFSRDSTVGAILEFEGKSFAVQI